MHAADGDGALTGAEATRGPVGEVHSPGRLFADRTTVTLGGKSVEMIHVGPTHSECMTVLRFPAEEAVFLLDFISLKYRDWANYREWRTENIAGMHAILMAR